MQYRFEKLKVWQQAREFCNSVYSITKSFPRDERFALIDQIRRAAVSIVLNIAEGSNRRSDPDFVRFLKIAQASLCETITAFYIALDQGYLGQADFNKLYEDSILLSSRITATIKSINRSA